MSRITDLAAWPKRCLMACALGLALVSASLSAGAPAAQAHAVCNTGYHTDWHTFYFHTDYHNYHSRSYVGLSYGLDGRVYNKWTYWYQNSPHGQYYSTTCKWLAPGY